MSSYEVWCHSCNVTFPPEQKTCIHCGGRLRSESPRRGLRAARREPEFVLTPQGFEEVPAGGPAEIEGPLVAGAGPAMSGTGPVDEEPVRRSLMRAGMTVVWMVLLAAGYAWRACSQGQ